MRPLTHILSTGVESEGVAGVAIERNSLVKCSFFCAVLLSAVIGVRELHSKLGSGHNDV